MLGRRKTRYCDAFGAIEIHLDSYKEMRQAGKSMTIMPYDECNAMSRWRFFATTLCLCVFFSSSSHSSLLRVFSVRHSLQFHAHISCVNALRPSVAHVEYVRVYVCGVQIIWPEQSQLREKKEEKKKQTTRVQL